jgi:hypothetical protein
MPPHEITGICNSVRPKRRYFIAAKLRWPAGFGNLVVSDPPKQR